MTLFLSLLLLLPAQPDTAPQSAALSPAERKIDASRRAIEKDPGKAQPYCDLALALARRARETSDTVFYKQADEALAKAFAIDPKNFSARKTQVWILLGQHEFAKALAAAQAINKEVPDDLLTYGFLTDANIELGLYGAAEKSAQRMLDLRPGNIPALTRAAYLRELFGDPEGSIELMNMAFEGTSPGEREDRAWILTQIAHLRFSQGKTADAGMLLEKALETFPSYHYALGGLAKVRVAQKRYRDAVDLLSKRYAAAPHAENLYVLAEATELAGDRARAKTQFAEFERKSRAEMMIADNSNHELVFYYADHARQPAEALRVAQSEFDRRKDVHTLHAYAWALHRSGNDREARVQIDRALAVGTQDSDFFSHAAAIYSGLGEKAQAKEFSRKAMALAPSAEPASKLMAHTKSGL